MADDRGSRFLRLPYFYMITDPAAANVLLGVKG